MENRAKALHIRNLLISFAFNSTQHTSYYEKFKLVADSSLSLSIQDGSVITEHLEGLTSDVEENAGRSPKGFLNQILMDVPK